MIGASPLWRLHLLPLSERFIWRFGDVVAGALHKAHGDEWSELDDPDQDIHPKNVGVRVGIPSYVAQARKGRIYIGEGEAPPGGEHVEEGPRGGRYYEANPEAGREKDWRVHAVRGTFNRVLKDWNVSQEQAEAAAIIWFWEWDKDGGALLIDRLLGRKAAKAHLASRRPDIAADKADSYLDSIAGANPKTDRALSPTVLRALRLASSKALRAAGLKSVKIYRGVSGKMYEDLVAGKEYPSRPLESWTLSMKVAEDWAGAEGYFDGAVVSRELPVDQVFLLSDALPELEGMGQNEVVVMSNSGDAIRLAEGDITPSEAILPIIPEEGTSDEGQETGYEGSEGGAAAPHVGRATGSGSIPEGKQKVEKATKVYLEPNEPAPPGANVQEGPRGGRYYEGAPAFHGTSPEAAEAIRRMGFANSPSRWPLFNSDLGFYMTSSEEDARYFADAAPDAAGKGVVLKVTVSMKHPMVVESYEDIETWAARQLAGLSEGEDFESEEDEDAWYEELTPYEVRAELEGAGYDGVVMTRPDLGQVMGATWYVAFDSDAITVSDLLKGGAGAAYLVYPRWREAKVEKHLPGKHNQKDHGPDGGAAGGEIEHAPVYMPDMDRRREEAIKRVKEWRDEGQPVESIIKDGYLWRKRAKTIDVAKHARAWDWAVWEQIQALAKEHGYEYKDTLTAEDVFNDPMLPDPERVLDDPQYQRAEDASDNPITAYRNTNKAHPLLKFLKSKDGVVWHGMSLRKLWCGAKLAGGRTFSRGSFGADRHFETFDPFPGMTGLLGAKTWEQALDTEVTVYRGVIDPKHGENLAGKPVVSYTTSPQIARLFAEGYFYNYNKPGQGKVYERKVKFGDILGYLNPDGEYEILLTPPKRKVEKLFKGAPAEPMDSRAHTGNRTETTTGIVTTNQGVAGSSDVQDSRNSPITLAEIAHAEVLLRTAAMGINKSKTDAESDLPSRIAKRGPRRWPSPLERVNMEIGRTKKAVASVTKRLWGGEVDLDQWHREMRDLVGDIYGKAAYASILRLKEQPEARQRARDNLLMELRHQYYYLDKFRDDVASGHVKTEKQAAWRANMYCEHSAGLYHRTVAEGSPMMKAYWRLNKSAEHCSDCLEMAQKSPWPATNLPRMPRDGSTRCRGNCKCHLAYRRGVPRYRAVRRKSK